MAFEYSFKLNNQPLLATLGATVVDKLEEPLDEGALNIPITVFGHQYKMLGLLQIEVTNFTTKDVCSFVTTENFISSTDQTTTPLPSCGQGTSRIICNLNLDSGLYECITQVGQVLGEKDEIVKSFTYLIINDKVNTISKDGFYSHELRAIEYTHKLDKYLINTLTFTRPFIRKSLAPFEYLAESSSNIGTGAGVLLPKIDIKQFFITNKNEIVYQCKKALANIGGVSTEVDVYIESNATGNTTKQILSQQNATFNFQSNGDYYIQVGVTVDGITFSDPIIKFFIRSVNEVRYTLYDMLMRVRAITPLECKLYFNETRIFDIDATTENYLKRIEMPQMFLQQMTARQVLNLMFKYINAISRLVYVNGNLDKLSFDEFNAIQGVFDDRGIVDLSSEISAQQYGTKGISWLGDTLQSNFRDNPSIKSPAQDRFKTVRATNIQMTDSDFELKLESEIYEFSKLEVIIPRVAITNANVTVFVDNLLLDLTPRVPEKSFWDLKNVTVNFPTAVKISPYTQNVGLRLNKVANIFWEKGKKSLSLSTTFGEFQKQQIIINVIEEALNEHFTLTPYRNIAGAFGKATFQIYSGVALTTNVFRGLMFNIEYITLKKPTMQVNRTDISENNYNAEIRLNQQSRFTDYGRASRDAYGQLQRSAVPSVEFTKIHTSFLDMLEVGMIDSLGYIITQRSLTFYNEHIEATYVATLDHNRLNEFVGIDQEYRVFENPSFNQIYDRRDFYNEYLMITNPTAGITNEGVLYTNTMKQRLFNRLYLREITPRKVSFAYIRTDGMVEIYPNDIDLYFITVPIVAFGGKDGVAFNFGFNHNQVAGDALQQQGSTNFYNEPIRYTNEFGFFDYLWFQFGDNYDYNPIFDFNPIFPIAEVNANKEHKYPLFKITSNLLGDDNYLVGSNSPFFESPNSNPMVIFKDASSTYNFTYQISIIPLNHKEYVIGQAFYTDNTMVTNPEVRLVNGVETNISPKMYLYRYKNGTKYNKFDDLIVKGGWFDKVELTSLNVINDATKLEFVDLMSSTYTSWAIGDEDENLYIACNFDFNGFKKASKHFRPAMLNIGGGAYSLFNSITIGLTTTFDVGYTRTTNLLNDDISFKVDSSFKTEYTRSTNILNTELGFITLSSFDVNYVKSTDFVKEHGFNSNALFDVVGVKSTDYVRQVSINQGSSVSTSYERTTNVLNNNVSFVASTGISYSYRISTDVVDDISIMQGSTISTSYERTTNKIGQVAFNQGSSITTDRIKSTDFVRQVSINQGSSISVERIKNVNKEITINQGSTFGIEAIKSTDLVRQIAFNQGSTLSIQGVKSTNLVNGLVGFNQGSSISTAYTKQTVQWVSGGTQPVGTANCTTLAHVGNVKCGETCSFVTQSTYSSINDETTQPPPSCSQNATRTVCQFNFGTGEYDCVVQIGTITYVNCEVCELV